MAPQQTGKVCSCTLCLVHREYERPSIQDCTTDDSNNNLYCRKYNPMRENKLIQELVNKRAVNGDIRKEILSCSSLEDKADLRPTKFYHLMEVDPSEESISQGVVEIVDVGGIPGEPVSVHCSCSMCNPDGYLAPDAHYRRRFRSVFVPSCTSFHATHHYCQSYHGGRLQMHQVNTDKLPHHKHEYMENDSRDIRKAVKPSARWNRALPSKAKHIRSVPCTCTFDFKNTVRSSIALVKQMKKPFKNGLHARESNHIEFEDRNKTTKIKGRNQSVEKINVSEGRLIYNLEANTIASVNKVRKYASSRKRHMEGDTHKFITDAEYGARKPIQIDKIKKEPDEVNRTQIEELKELEDTYKPDQFYQKLDFNNIENCIRKGYKKTIDKIRESKQKIKRKVNEVRGRIVVEKALEQRIVRAISTDHESNKAGNVYGKCMTNIDLVENKTYAKNEFVEDSVVINPNISTELAEHINNPKKKRKHDLSNLLSVRSIKEHNYITKDENSIDSVHNKSEIKLMTKTECLKLDKTRYIRSTSFKTDTDNSSKSVWSFIRCLSSSTAETNSSGTPSIAKVQHIKKSKTNMHPQLIADHLIVGKVPETTKQNIDHSFERKPVYKTTKRRRRTLKYHPKAQLTSQRSTTSRSMLIQTTKRNKSKYFHSEYNQKLLAYPCNICIAGESGHIESLKSIKTKQRPGTNRRTKHSNAENKTRSTSVFKLQQNNPAKIIQSSVVTNCITKVPAHINNESVKKTAIEARRQPSFKFKGQLVAIGSAIDLDYYKSYKVSPVNQSPVCYEFSLTNVKDIFNTRVLYKKGASEGDTRVQTAIQNEKSNQIHTQIGSAIKRCFCSLKLIKKTKDEVETASNIKYVSNPKNIIKKSVVYPQVERERKEYKLQQHEYVPLHTCISSETDTDQMKSISSLKQCSKASSIVDSKHSSIDTEPKSYQQNATNNIQNVRSGSSFNLNINFHENSRTAKPDIKLEKTILKQTKRNFKYTNRPEIYTKYSEGNVRLHSIVNKRLESENIIKENKTDSINPIQKRCYTLELGNEDQLGNFKSPLGSVIGYNFSNSIQVNKSFDEIKNITQLTCKRIKSSLNIEKQANPKELRNHFPTFLYSNAKKCKPDKLLKVLNKRLSKESHVHYASSTKNKEVQTIQIKVRQKTCTKDLVGIKYTSPKNKHYRELKHIIRKNLTNVDTTRRVVNTEGKQGMPKDHEIMQQNSKKVFKKTRTQGTMSKHQTGSQSPSSFSSRGSNTRSILRRCFCKLKLQGKETNISAMPVPLTDNNGTMTPSYKAKKLYCTAKNIVPYKRGPNRCEPGICTPRKACDYYSLIYPQGLKRYSNGTNNAKHSPLQELVPTRCATSIGSNKSSVDKCVMMQNRYNVNGSTIREQQNRDHKYPKLIHESQTQLSSEAQGSGRRPTLKRCFGTLSFNHGYRKLGTMIHTYRNKQGMKAKPHKPLQRSVYVYQDKMYLKNLGTSMRISSSKHSKKSGNKSIVQRKSQSTISLRFKTSNGDCGNKYAVQMNSSGTLLKHSPIDEHRKTNSSIFKVNLALKRCSFKLLGRDKPLHNITNRCNQIKVLNSLKVSSRTAKTNRSKRNHNKHSKTTGPNKLQRYSCTTCTSQLDLSIREKPHQYVTETPTFHKIDSAKQVVRVRSNFSFSVQLYNNKNLEHSLEAAKKVNPTTECEGDSQIINQDKIIKRENVYVQKCLTKHPNKKREDKSKSSNRLGDKQISKLKADNHRSCSFLQQCLSVFKLLKKPRHHTDEIKETRNTQINTNTRLGLEPVDTEIVGKCNLECYYCEPTSYIPGRYDKLRQINSGNTTKEIGYSATTTTDTNEYHMTQCFRRKPKYKYTLGFKKNIKPRNINVVQHSHGQPSTRLKGSSIISFHFNNNLIKNHPYANTKDAHYVKVKQPRILKEKCHKNIQIIEKNYKVRRSSRKKDNQDSEMSCSESYECEPVTSASSQCDLYECLKSINNRQENIQKPSLNLQNIGIIMYANKKIQCSVNERKMLLTPKTKAHRNKMCSVVEKTLHQDLKEKTLSNYRFEPKDYTILPIICEGYKKQNSNLVCQQKTSKMCGKAVFDSSNVNKITKNIFTLQERYNKTSQNCLDGSVKTFFETLKLVKKTSTNVKLAPSKNVIAERRATVEGVQIKETYNDGIAMILPYIPQKFKENGSKRRSTNSYKSKGRMLIPDKNKKSRNRTQIKASLSIKGFPTQSKQLTFKHVISRLFRFCRRPIENISSKNKQRPRRSNVIPKKSQDLKTLKHSVTETKHKRHIKRTKHKKRSHIESGDAEQTTITNPTDNHTINSQKAKRKNIRRVITLGKKRVNSIQGQLASEIASTRKHKSLTQSYRTICDKCNEVKCVKGIKYKKFNVKPKGKKGKAKAEKVDVKKHKFQNKSKKSVCKCKDNLRSNKDTCNPAVSHKKYVNIDRSDDVDNWMQYVV